jgi:hypothetical protein
MVMMVPSLLPSPQLCSKEQGQGTAIYAVSACDIVLQNSFISIVSASARSLLRERQDACHQPLHQL